MHEHRYRAGLSWSGHRCAGTTSYDSYGRNFEVQMEGKSRLPGLAHECCFIASSVAFPVVVDATVRVADPAADLTEGMSA